MSIPTQVFEDGRWVTRLADIHHVLTQNRDTKTFKFKEAAQVPEPPSLGLLTRTIVPSPMVKWIIPARIRHPDKNDVLYITTCSVAIKEAHGDYTLTHVAIKDDFDSPIKAARICGLQRELTKPDINAIIKREEHWQDSVQYNHSGDTDQLMDEDTDMHTKDDLDQFMETVNDKIDDADARSMQTIPLHRRTLSPHILVLTLESGKLVFLYTVNGDADIPVIVTSQRALWRGQRPVLDQIGRHIAVDPRSRAIAIAAQENAYYVFALKPMADLQRDVQKWPQIHPIISERAFEVDGVILKMEFLYPPQNDSDQIILLLIVCKNGRCRLVWSEWNSASSLPQAHVRTLAQVLPADEQVPLLLIPTIAFTAFILVCENCISLFRDLLTGTPSRYTHKLHEALEPEEAGSSRRKPLWVQWARVLRSTTHRAQGDGLYLCREDGIVHFLNIKYGHPSLIDSTHQVGKLDTNIDSSFAVLDIGPHCSDLLAAGGDGSEGGLWKFDAREPPKKIAKDRNWTPVVDCCTPMALKKSHLADISPDQKPVYNQRVFACVGRARHGALSEFRYGLPALRHLTIPLAGLLDSGVLAVWAFRDRLRDNFYVALSHPKQTYLLRVRFASDEDNSVAELVDNNRVFGLQERTVMMKALAGGRFIQVTERAVWTSSFGVVDGFQGEEASRYDFGSARVLAACIGQHGSEWLSLIALEDHGNCHLRLANVDEMHKALGGPLKITSQVTAVALTLVANDICLIVGFLCATLEMFVSNENAEWKSVSKYDFGHDFGHEFAVCESIAVSLPATEDDDGFSMLIACGLRNGSLQTLKYRRTETAHDVLGHDIQVLGYTPVKVVTTTSNPTRFLAQVENDLYSLEYRTAKPKNKVVSVHPIWFTDDEKPEWQPGPLSAMIIVQDLEAPSTVADISDLVRTDRNNVHIAQINLASGPENVHRSMLVGGTPTRAVYSERLGKVVVLNHRIKVIRSSRKVGDRTHPGKRTLQPVITFVDPDSTRDESLLDDDIDMNTDEAMDTMRKDTLVRSLGHHDHEVLAYEPGERFLGVFEWCPKIGDDEFHMLIAHTTIRTARGIPTKGRLMLYRVSVLDGHVRLTLKRVTSPSAPIYAVAIHPNRTSIVYHTGEELRILRLEASDTGFKWSISMKAQLRSMARHITIEVPYIYVTTAGNSLAVFIEKNGSLAFVANDTVARQGLHHLSLLPDLTVIADMGGSVTGLWQPPHLPRIDSSLSTLFEASLPHAAMRLQPIVLPTWRKISGEDSRSMVLEETGSDWPVGQILFLGVATTGAFTQYRLLKPRTWPVLRFIKNIAERSPLLCPFPDGPNMRHLDPMRSSKPECRAVNGDILARVWNRGGVELLWHLLNRAPTVEGRYLDFATAKDRWDGFKELLIHMAYKDQDLIAQTIEKDETQLGVMVSNWLQGIVRHEITSSGGLSGKTLEDLDIDMAHLEADEIVASKSKIGSRNARCFPSINAWLSLCS